MAKKGRKAATTGRAGEKILQWILNRPNVIQLSYKEWQRVSGGLLYDKRATYVVSNYPRSLLWAKEGRKEFFVSMNYRKAPVGLAVQSIGERCNFLLEVKHQDVSGTTDLKPFAELSNVRLEYINNLVMIMSGEWWNSARGNLIVKALQVEALQLQEWGRNAVVMKAEKFADWLNDHLAWC